jgi:amino acid adenylation domain-containing protein
MIGPLINTLPVRVSVDPAQTMLALLQSLRAQSVQTRAYQHTSLMQIQQWSDVPQGTPLFNSLVVFETFLLHDVLHAQGGAWQNRIFQLRRQPNYPLSVAAFGGRQFRIKIIYDTRRFDQDQITRMLGHMQMALEAMVVSPNRRLHEVGLLTADERRQMLFEWNATAASYPQQIGLHDLVAAQAARTPEAIAAVDSSRTITYRELNTRANQLAHYLQTIGIGPERVVGVCMDRSVDVLIGQLAILKAGGAFLPLDPSYPPDRLAYMIRDSRALALLAHTHCASRLPDHQAQVICLDCDSNLFSGQSDENPTVAATTDNLAYVIYTSGSTGRPKGVEIPHAGLINLVTWHCNAYHVTQTDRATHLAAPSFDATVWEIWPYLTTGACLYLPDEDTRMTPTRLLAWLREHQITIAFLPTALAETLLAIPWLPDLALRALLVGGDRLHHVAHDPPFALYNHYGPTENAVVSTCSRVISGPDGDLMPTIGRPIANVDLYVLDASLQPVPIGVPGELYIGGVSLARGYRFRPDWTAERFIPHPFSSQPGSRLYRSGDVVRYRSDGQLEFLSRADQQVKIRGFRIELGEIEAILTQYVDVREAVVVADGAEKEKRLVAYVVPHTGHSLAIDDLRAYLTARLPDYMAPIIVPLEALPLTANGKLDRHALPKPVRPEHERTIVTPRTEVEETLADIWSRTLGLELQDGQPAISIHDNFFILGGHSLLAIQAMLRVSEIFKVDLPLQSLFDAPTISAFAEVVQRAVHTKTTPTTTPAIERLDRRKYQTVKR